MGGGATLSLVGQSQESVVCQVPLGGWPKAQRAQEGNRLPLYDFRLVGLSWGDTRSLVRTIFEFPSILLFEY